jgi:predicted nucleic acid-binding protein
VTECLGVLRRDERRGRVTDQRASLAVTDLGDLGVNMFPTSPMRARVWSLRHNLTVSDAMFVVLAERLGETLVTRDRRLANAARRHAGIDVIVLPR